MDKVEEGFKYLFLQIWIACAFGNYGVESVISVGHKLLVTRPDFDAIFRGQRHTCEAPNAVQRNHCDEDGLIAILSRNQGNLLPALQEAYAGQKCLRGLPAHRLLANPVWCRAC
jgi:hypothetical protein